MLGCPDAWREPMRQFKLSCQNKNPRATPVSWSDIPLWFKGQYSETLEWTQPMYVYQRHLNILRNSGIPFKQMINQSPNQQWPPEYPWFDIEISGFWVVMRDLMNTWWSFVKPLNLCAKLPIQLVSPLVVQPYSYQVFLQATSLWNYWFIVYIEMKSI